MNEQEDKDVAPATIEACGCWRGKRRVASFDWPHVGRVMLQSAMAGEWIAIDAARTRARMAALSGNVKLHEQATREFFLSVCYGLVLNTELGKMFSNEHRDLLLEMDAAITDPLIEACMKHCDIEAIDLGAAQKK